MKDCPCKVDHWLHAAAGLQGITGMMAHFAAAGLEPSPEALAKIEEQLTILQKHLSSLEGVTKLKG